MRRFLAAGLLLLPMTCLCAAQDEQKHEIAVTVGRTFISDQTVPNTSFFNNTIHSGAGLSFNFSYAHALRTYQWGSVWLEIPFLWNPDEDLNYGQNVIPIDYSSLFLTPAARVRFLEGFAFHPWVSFGGGYGRFFVSDKLLFGGPNPGGSGNTGLLQMGVGLDVKVHGPWGIRLAARDFWSGHPPLLVETNRDRQHNFFVGGGVTWQF